MSTWLNDEVIISKNFFPRKPSPQDDTRYDIVESAGGIKLYCHSFVLYRSFWDSLWRRRASKTLVFFHGNGELVADYVGGKFKEGLEEAGFNIFFVEYRGYGNSDGKPGFTIMFEDLPYIHDYLVNRLGLQESEMIVFGRSMGGLFATEFASLYPNIAGLVLECTFSDPSPFIFRRVSVDPALVAQYPLEKIQEEVKKHINNGEKLKKINPALPVLILHAADDNLIEKSHAVDNFEACASTKKKLVMYPIGQHNFFHAANSEGYEIEGVKYKSIYEEVKELAGI